MFEVSSSVRTITTSIQASSSFVRQGAVGIAGYVRKRSLALSYLDIICADRASRLLDLCWVRRSSSRGRNQHLASSADSKSCSREDYRQGTSSFLQTIRLNGAINSTLRRLSITRYPSVLSFPLTVTYRLLALTTL